MISLIAQIAAAGGFPLWAVLVSALLTGGTGAALFQFLSARNTARAAKEVTSSVANLNDVSALNAAITGLAGENQRMASRLLTVEGEVVALKTELGKRPTREELRTNVMQLQNYIEGLHTYIGKLRNQLTEAGLVPIKEDVPLVPMPDFLPEEKQEKK